MISVGSWVGAVVQVECPAEGYLVQSPECARGRYDVSNPGAEPESVGRMWPARFARGITLVLVPRSVSTHRLLNTKTAADDSAESGMGSISLGTWSCSWECILPCRQHTGRRLA